MEVVAHYRIGVDGNGKALGQQVKSLFDPVLAVFEGLPGVSINPAQEGAAHAALDAVVGSRGAGCNQRGACGRHGAIVACTRP